MNNELVTPNLHVALVHFPIALLVIGTFIELFSFFWRRSGFRSAGRWMILIGAVLAVPTTFSGIFAYNHAYKMGVAEADQFAPWEQIKSVSPLNASQRDYLWGHTWKQILATELAMLAVLVWIGSSDRYRRRLRLPLLALLLIANLFMLSGAWFGGEMVYREGVALQLTPAARAQIADRNKHVDIADEVFTLPSTTGPVSWPATQPTTSISAGAATTSPTTLATLYVAPTSQPATLPTTEKPNPLAAIEAVLPPMQMHVIFAGLAIAMSLIAFSLSVRAWSSAGLASPLVEYLPHDELTPRPAIDSPNVDPTKLSSANAVADALLLTPSRVPSTRFWLLAIFITILTALLGDYLIAKDASAWNLHDFLNQIKMSGRRTAHVVFAVSIIAPAFILLCLSRWAPRKKLVATIFAAVLLIAVALQIWMGILLLFDGSDGALTRFK